MLRHVVILPYKVGLALRMATSCDTATNAKAKRRGAALIGHG